MSADGPPRDASRLVGDELRAFLEEAGKQAGRLLPGAVLTEELGLSSAEVAQLLARLGTRLGLPSRRPSFTDVRTVGDLYSLYAPAREPGRRDADPLESSRRRAEARRHGRST